MKLPKLSEMDEHHFYVLEGAILQLFGESSYQVFLAISHYNRVPSLAYTSAHEFTSSALEESEEQPETAEDIFSVMSQILCVRRCIFAPVVTMLNDCFGEEMLQRAIDEEGADEPYRVAVRKAIGSRFMELAEDDAFCAYFGTGPENLELERQNMVRLMANCQLFAEKQDIKMVLSPPVKHEQITRYIIEQFAFATCIMKDYLSRY